MQGFSGPVSRQGLCVRPTRCRFDTERLKQAKILSASWLTFGSLLIKSFPLAKCMLNKRRSLSLACNKSSQRCIRWGRGSFGGCVRLASYQGQGGAIPLWFTCLLVSVIHTLLQGYRLSRIFCGIRAFRPSHTVTGLQVCIIPLKHEISYFKIAEAV